MPPPKTASGPEHRVLLLVLTLVPFAACGGPVGAPNDNGSDDALPCGPNGRLHRGPGADPHCHCDDGYYELNGTCVEETHQDEPESPTPTTPDCGENGRFNGRSCECDSGYTQTGLRDLRTCERIPACVGANDAHEPNDVPAESALMTDVDGMLYACPADADWFVFSVTSGDLVEALIEFDGGAVDLDLFMYGPSSPDPRAFSVDAETDFEAAAFTARADGTAGILVLPYGIGEGSYELVVDVTEGEGTACSGPGSFCRGSSDCCSGVCHVGHCH